MSPDARDCGLDVLGCRGVEVRFITFFFSQKCRKSVKREHSSAFFELCGVPDHKNNCIFCITSYQIFDLKKKLPGHAIHAWFDPIVAVGFEKESFILEVPNQFSLEWIESHYKEEITFSIK